MPESQYRLVKHFAKPEPGEFVPIGFIEMTKENVAWSPRLKQSIYVTPGMPDAGEFKRVREVNVLRVVNKLSVNISTIELTDDEKEQFENVDYLFVTLSRKRFFGYSTVNIAVKDTQNNLSKNLSIFRNKAKPWRWLENGRYANEKASSQTNLSLAGQEATWMKSK